ncbi:MAG: transcriptional repressor [Planctomycetes bacterium]|nr:transcriptional repressor [Planctomycetota bacterium]
MREELAAFRDFLRRRGLKCTSQRMRVAERVLQRRDHFSAEAVMDDLRRGGEAHASKATVYRTLVLLEECRLLDSQDFGDGFRSYEPAWGVQHHDHLVCLSCRRIIEFTDHDIERSQERVANSHGFRVTSHIHRIFGYCSDCQDSTHEARQRNSRS